jgi:hypothetical protein
MRLKLLRVSPTQLETYKNDPPLLQTRMQGDAEEDPALLDMDKAWEGVLFLLTGAGLRKNTHPLSKVFFSERVVNENLDMGYGPPEYLLPEEVKALYTEISGLTPAALEERFDAEKMIALHIYPGIWQEEGVVYYLLAFFGELQALFAKAAEQDEVIVTVIL